MQHQHNLRPSSNPNPNSNPYPDPDPHPLAWSTVTAASSGRRNTVCRCTSTTPARRSASASCSAPSRVVAAPLRSIAVLGQRPETRPSSPAVLRSWLSAVQHRTGSRGCVKPCPRVTCDGLQRMQAFGVRGFPARDPAASRELIHVCWCFSCWVWTAKSSISGSI